MFTSGPTGGEALGEYRGDTLYHGSLDSAEHLELLDRNRYSLVSHVAEGATCGHHTIWLAQL
jgi:hypothetical protein